MCEAVSSRTAFYGIRIGDSVVAAAARFDDGDGAVRLMSAYTEPDFRRTGFARACSARALAEAHDGLGYMVASQSNAAIAAMAKRFGAEVTAVDLARRWVSPLTA
jgi:GNAT superfamily N-acetyltransferase